jgi:hypothetical protein
MNIGSYFTNLISSDLSDPVDYPASQTENMELPTFYGFGLLDDTPPLDEVPTVDDAHAAGKEKKGQKNNIEEDKLLVTAWLNVSQDAIQGADQAKSTYWSRVHQYFHANKAFDSDSSQVSIMNRWYSIQHDVNVFASCFAKIEDRNQSRCSIDDKVCQMHLVISLFIAEL